MIVKHSHSVLKMSASIDVDVAKESPTLMSPNTQSNKEKENAEASMDAPELASLLQCIGFSLQSFEKKTDAENQKQSLVDFNDGYLQVDITCTKSHMKATLIKERTGCKCPSKEDASKAEFWNISACSPSLPGNITISKSSLIPTISENKSKLINILILKALHIINSNDVGKSVDDLQELLVTPSTLVQYRSLENLKIESFTTTSRTLVKNQTWEARASSPKQTSSPIPELHNSLKNASLDSEKTSKLADILTAARKLLSDAIDLTSSKNSTFTKRPRRLSDIKISPLTVENQKSGGSSSPSVSSKPDTSTCKTPKKPAPKKITSTTSERKRILIAPTKLNLLKARKLESISPSCRPCVPNSKLSLSATKMKTAIKTDAAIPKLRAPSKIASFTSGKNVKK